MRRALTLLLCVLLASPACATRRLSTSSMPAIPQALSGARVDPALMADYIRQLPVGSRIKLSLADGTTLRGTLMKRDADPIVVQKRTRLPEAPVEVAVRDILALDVETNGSTGRTVAIAIGGAVAATLGVLLLLAAIYSD